MLTKPSPEDFLSLCNCSLLLSFLPFMELSFYFFYYDLTIKSILTLIYLGSLTTYELICLDVLHSFFFSYQIRVVYLGRYTKAKSHLHFVDDMRHRQSTFVIFTLYWFYLVTTVEWFQCLQTRLSSYWLWWGSPKLMDPPSADRMDVSIIQSFNCNRKWSRHCIDVVAPQKSHKVNRRNFRLAVCTVQLGPPGGT